MIETGDELQQQEPVDPVEAPTSLLADASKIAGIEVTDRSLEAASENGDNAKPLAGDEEKEVINDTPDSREALKILSMKPKELNKELAKLEESSNPKDKAFAADFKIALKQSELVKLKSQSGNTEAEKTRIEQRKKDLTTEIESMQEARKKIEEEGGGEQIPNQVESLAKKFGAEETNNPLGEIMGEVTKLGKMKPEQRQQIYEGYKESKMTEQEIAFLENGIKAIQAKEKRERIAGIAGKVGLGSLILMIFMMISAFKQGEGGAQ